MLDKWGKLRAPQHLLFLIQPNISRYKARHAKQNAAMPSRRQKLLGRPGPLVPQRRGSLAVLQGQAFGVSACIPADTNCV